MHDAANILQYSFRTTNRHMTGNGVGTEREGECSKSGGPGFSGCVGTVREGECSKSGVPGFNSRAVPSGRDEVSSVTTTSRPFRYIFSLAMT